MKTIHDQSELTEKQINKIKVRLHEVHHAICHWTAKERIAKNYLAERLSEEADLKNQLQAKIGVDKQ
jgi:hypothetical protein